MTQDRRPRSWVRKGQRVKSLLGNDLNGRAMLRIEPADRIAV